MKMCFFGVFLHAEFISALKTEPKSIVFEKHAKNGKKKYLSSLFSMLLLFSLKVSSKNVLIPTESCFLDGKKLNTSKIVDINFLPDNEKNCQAIGFAKLEA